MPKNIIIIIKTTSQLQIYKKELTNKSLYEVFNVPATDIWVMSIAPTQIHLAASMPKATGRDWKK